MIFPGPGGAGESDDWDSGVIHDRGAHVGATRQHVEDPGRQAGLFEDAANTTPPLIAVRGSGLQITALPNAEAGAMARMARMTGALKGAITPTTPTGSRRAIESRC